MSTCEFCKKEFSTNQTLKTHIKTAKKCLKLRKENIEKNIEEIIEEIIYNCEYCKFTTTLKNSLKRHQISCNNFKTLQKKKETQSVFEEKEFIKNKLKKEYDAILNSKNIIILRQKKDIIKLEIENKEYKDKIFSLVSIPTITHTHTNNNILELNTINFDPQYIKDKVENNFTLAHLSDGLRGVAKFTKDHILTIEGKASYTCTDTSRKVFKYKDVQGGIQKDINAEKLKKVIKEPISRKSLSLYEKESKKLWTVANDKKTSVDDNEISNNNLTFLTDSFIKIKRFEEDPEFTRELSAII
jgi:hypothetical protein